MSNPALQRTNWAPIFEWFQRFGAIITVAAIAVFGFWGGHFLLPGQEHDHSESEELVAQTSSEANQVTLSPEKLQAAQLVVEQADVQPFQSLKTVPGSITYDATRKVDLRATVNSVVKNSFVKSAQTVEAGQAILMLSSPEIGAARNEISQCEATRDLLAKEYAWTLDTHTNIEQLLAYLEQNPTSEEIASRFENKNLGEHRNEILTAYSEANLARKSADRINQLDDQGAIPGKIADQRRSQLEIAVAKLNAIREETAFQNSQGLAMAKANLEAAEKQLGVAREKLAALLGPNGSDELEPSDSALSDFVLNAPIAGQIVNLQAVESARFEPGEVMAEIADTTMLWVEAQISQRDWHSVTLTENQQLTIRVPAIPDEKFQATVRYIGSSVSRTTLAIPLVAELPNHENEFRPGMSVWVDIPTSKTEPTLVVAEGAIQRNEMEPFVFVQLDDATFEMRTVVVGRQSHDQIEILSGLQAGERVVVEGAFFLKSEWMLAEEE